MIETTSETAETLRLAQAPCALGTVLVAVGDRGLRAVLLGDDAATLRADLTNRFPAAELAPADETAAALLADVVAALATPRQAVELPLDPRGTGFQLRVWEELRAIPAGRTASYAEIAARLGRPGGARAVARACAANALAVVVPCHRVVRGDGSLAGYRWGIERQRRLLAHEAA